MKLQYLGTAAFEGIPALFCQCDTCKAARKQGGRSIRTRSQALVDDTLLIDFPADTYIHILREGIDLGNIHSLLVTHDHSDHLYPEDICGRENDNYAMLREETPLKIYGSPAVAAHIRAVVAADSMEGEHPRVQLVTMEPYTPYQVEGYTVIALPATHSTETGPYAYLISKDGKTLLYNHDSGPWKQEVWDFLATHPLHIDFASCDCTAGDAPMYYDSHGNLERCLQLKQQLEAMGLADAHTQYCVNHFSHNGGHVLYEDMAARTAKVGVLTSYDGMSVEF